MILIITHKLDFTADFVINKLNGLNLAYLRLNCEDLLTTPLYVIDTKSGLEIEFEQLPPVNSIWFRRTQIPDLPGLSMEERSYFYREFDALIDNISCSLSEKKWLSNPFALRQAESKTLQLRLAQITGFLIPATLVTNNKIRLQEFFNKNTQTIIKPMYSGRVVGPDDSNLFFTSLITQDKIDQLADYFLTPCIYQEYIEKEYELRVTVVENDIYTVKIHSQTDQETETDWRRGKPLLTIYELPADIKQKCLDLCAGLHINFGAIDLIRSKTGEYIFLEINPNGQWAWIEMATGLPISKSIIKYLTDEPA
ncbi:hypothetical protein FO440_22565 [Mucilaginibacter corticis]|uniref:ATP-grasp domain-containing protein n=1 Tax=Mucilaginibacter corticis TaxID=2597670 RepID=A0A556M9P0_9SPHI|nr:hypothetical protein [Mucilaginibacter corticis]TSJ36613.1 hypothetical protein FO440_22565 [Mucilaginibacter corticis]